MNRIVNVSAAIERAMVRLENAAKQQREAERISLTGRAIFINMCENLIALKWNKKLKAIEITSRKVTKYLY